MKNLQIIIFLAIHAVGILSANLGYCTYHAYSAETPLTTCACSDGEHGIITRFGYNNLSPLYPYVSAWNKSGWNSPACGECIQLRNPVSGKIIHVTAIDQCGNAPSGFNSHFDLAPEAFKELLGEEGVQKGHGTAEWSIVPGSKCKGNRAREEVKFL